MPETPPIWQPGSATPLPADATIRIALARNADHPLALRH
jgi:hypothetical protein